jgi:hypothetical protein
MDVLPSIDYAECGSSNNYSTYLCYNPQSRAMTLKKTRMLRRRVQLQQLMLWYELYASDSMDFQTLLSSEQFHGLRLNDIKLCKPLV